MFQDAWFIGGDDGTLLCSNDLEQWQAIEPPLTGSITGLAANDERCIGVTDNGEIFVSTDGVHSQKALETALELGYENVYNLGSIDDWCYGLEGRDIEP